MTDGATVVGVYRHGNAAVMEQLCHQAQAAQWPVRLWALDRIAPALADRTHGSGQRPKFDALNALLAGGGGHDDTAPLVVVDDDVTMASDGLPRLLEVMAAAGLDIAQPAHDRHSHASHTITKQRRLSRARTTSYVEIGPVFAFSPRAQAHTLPFPDDIGMGWGLELHWADLEQEGLRLGIVDAVTMCHLFPPAMTYDATDESVRMLALVRERGGRALGDLQRTRAVWRPWQSAPSWVRA